MVFTKHQLKMIHLYSIDTGNGNLGIYILSISNFLLEIVLSWEQTYTNEVYGVIFNIT